MNLKIRALVEGDEADWRKLWMDYLTFYGSTVSEDVYQTSFRRMLSDDPHEFRGLVAERYGKLVGLTHFLYHRHGWLIENVCYLQDLFVDPDHRGAGIARALIEEVYAAAAREGVDRVYWLTQTSNTEAMKLYDRIATKTDFIKYQHVND